MTDLIEVSTFTEQEGVFHDIPDAVYHRSRMSLSSSGARSILEDTPKRFRWMQTHPRTSTDTFDLGHAVHSLVLGAGASIVDVGFDTYVPKAAKEARDKAYADGLIPLKSSEYRKAQDMAEAVFEYPRAARLFASGKPEVSLYHRDPATGVMLRARPDYIADVDGRTVLVDLKTTTDSSPRGFAKSVDSFGYWQQAAWYLDVAIAVGVATPDTQFQFVAVDKAPPHLVTVHELDPEYVEIGRQRNRLAIDIFHQCQQSGEWPGHPDEVNVITAPAWRTKGQQ